MGKGGLLGATGGCWEAGGDVPMMGAGPEPAPSLPSRATGWALPAPSSCPRSLGRTWHPRQELSVVGTVRGGLWRWLGDGLVPSAWVFVACVSVPVPKASSTRIIALSNR